MADQYKTKSTSSVTAKVDDRELSTNSITRRIIRSILVENPNNPEACVKITILHQRKGVNDAWTDVDADSLNKMKAGDIMKLSLDSAETLKLTQELNNLFAIHHDKGVPQGEKDIVVGFNSEIIKTDPERARIIEELLKQGYSEEVWKELVRNEPDLATKLSLVRLHENRALALEEFKASLKANKDEAYWQGFFEKNTWIFGYGLNYKFLKTVQSQPHYGGTSLTGKGAQRGDFLAATAAEVRYSVLVEVKKPTSPLLDNEYRNGAFPVGRELAGGVSQLQVNCRKWEMDGSKAEENTELLEKENILSVQPKGILVIGHTQQLDSKPKRNSFELYRRSTLNPEVITFDELFERARYIVEHDQTTVSI